MFIGALLLIVGALLHWGPSIPLLRWFGRLPGDIIIERPNFRLYLPLVSMLIVNIVLIIILRLIYRR